MAWPEFEDPFCGTVVTEKYKDADEDEQLDLALKVGRFCEEYKELCIRHGLFLWPDDPYCLLDVRSYDDKELETKIFKCLDELVKSLN